jgi:hypothetical protein
MAHFYANIKGNRGEATRIGTPKSGLSGHIRGWDIGAKVFCRVNSKGEDEIQVYSTSGSNGGGGDVYVATITKAGVEVAETLKK